MGEGVSFARTAGEMQDAVLRFSVPGLVRGKGRPRMMAFVDKKSGKAKARGYTPQQTAAYENLVKLAAEEAGARPVDGPVLVRLTIWMAIPKSTPKAKRALMAQGVMRPTRKPDIDNVVKAVMDGLNTVAFWA